MALNWKTVKREHIAQACELLASGEARPRVPAKGIFILYQGNKLPAKYAVKLAYCFANELSLDSKLTFSSGEGIVRLLRHFGFRVERTLGNDSSS